MHVILDVAGEIVVDNGAHIFNVDTTGGNVCGHHDGDLPGLEPGKRPLALALVLVSVNGGRADLGMVA